jgi:hypothetical protein
MGFDSSAGSQADQHQTAVSSSPRRFVDLWPTDGNRGNCPVGD